jgi:hypothetical protein
VLGGENDSSIGQSYGIRRKAEASIRNAVRKYWSSRRIRKSILCIIVNLRHDNSPLQYSLAKVMVLIAERPLNGTTGIANGIIKQFKPMKLPPI